MPKTFQTLTFIKKLISFSPRQLEGETRAGKYITKILRDYAVPYTLQPFKIHVPKVLRAELKADGKKIPCLSCSLVGGTIDGKERIISSMYNFDSTDADVPNININPHCPGISCVAHYRAPALAIAPRDVTRLVAAQKVKGVVKIKKTLHTSFNILIGNVKNPKHIIFTHYDSINRGALDNASGVGVCLKIITDQPELLTQCLFVIAGAEEISYDWPIYWAYGYRVFEKKYPQQMKKAKKIVIIDSAGAGKSSISQDQQFIYQAFPIVNVKKYAPKIFGIFSDFSKLLPIYHSDLDDGKNLTTKGLRDAANILAKAIH